MRYFSILFITFCLFCEQGRAEPAAVNLSVILQALAELKNVEISYNDKVDCYGERYKDQSGKSSKDYCKYLQFGSAWRYETTTERPDGTGIGIFFYGKDGVYKRFEDDSGSLMVGKDESAYKNLARWYNPFFVMFSFLYENEYYQSSIHEKYMLVESFSPLLCDLTPFADSQKLDSFLKERNIEQSVNSSDPLVLCVSTYVPLKEGGKRKLCDYKLIFKAPNDLFPVKMEKRDSHGNLIIQVSVTSFEAYKGISMPKDMKISCFVDAKLDREILVKLQSIHELESQDQVKDIDPSRAKVVRDDVHKISATPDEFK